MASISDIIKANAPKIKKVTDELKNKFIANFTAIYRTEGVPLIKKRLMEAYDVLAAIEEGEMGAAIRGKDPTSLISLRSLFEQQITTELGNNISVKGDELLIEFMDKSKLGFDGPVDESTSDGPPTTVDVLSFYLRGMIGEFAFITPEQYEARGRRSSKPLGRLGAGFLMSKRRYEQERWAEVTKLPFSDVRHAISGQSPYDGFREAIDAIDFQPIISSVLRKTMASLGSSIRG